MRSLNNNSPRYIVCVHSSVLRWFFFSSSFRSHLVCTFDLDVVASSFTILYATYTQRRQSSARFNNHTTRNNHQRLTNLIYSDFYFRFDSFLPRVCTWKKQKFYIHGRRRKIKQQFSTPPSIWIHDSIRRSVADVILVDAPSPPPHTLRFIWIFSLSVFLDPELSNHPFFLSLFLLIDSTFNQYV